MYKLFRERYGLVIKEGTWKFHEVNEGAVEGEF
jgi:hypothetical protein